MKLQDNKDLNFYLFKMPNININIFNYDPDIIYSKYINQPNIKYGFYYNINEIKNKFSNKYNIKKLRLVSDFEFDSTSININELSKKYFNSHTKIISRAFYKMWEILFLFDFFNKKKSLKILNIAEAPGSFIQSIIYYRNKMQNNNNDIFYSISIKDELITFDKELLKLYKNINILDKLNGDLTNNSVIKYIEKNINDADFITADGGFIWKDENYQEQEAYFLIFSEIITAIKC